MKTKTLEICLSVYENDTKTIYKSKFNNQEIIEKLIKIVNKYYAKEMYDYMFN